MTGMNRCRSPIMICSTLPIGMSGATIETPVDMNSSTLRFPRLWNKAFWTTSRVMIPRNR